MLDYYGSIVKSEDDINSEIIQCFRDRCYESYMKKMINNLRKEEVLQKEYSVSGWMVFHRKTILDMINIQLNHGLQKANKRIKFVYCYNQLFNDNDVCKEICDKL